MSRGLATIPHAPIERVAHTTGEVEQLAPGSFVNVVKALGIFARRHDPGYEGGSHPHGVVGRKAVSAAVVVELPSHDWVFLMDNDDKAAMWAEKLTQIALR